MSSKYTRAETWLYDVHRIEGDDIHRAVVESVIVFDASGKWVACIPGPGMDPDAGNTSEQAVERAKKFIWTCGAKPKKKEKE